MPCPAVHAMMPSSAASMSTLASIMLGVCSKM
jgi:hypothetical protein